MNEVATMIKKRRSIRGYRPDPISKEDLMEIAEAGVWAPNAMNEQLWHFSVVSDPEVIERMHQATIAGIMNSGVEFLMNKAKEPGYHAFHHAPAVIVISAKEGKFTTFDCGAAAENIALAATEKNIGNCILASVEFMFAGDKELRQVLHMPEEYQFVCAISLGYFEDSVVKTSDRKMEVIDFI